MSNRRTITSIDSTNNVTYFSVVDASTGESSIVYTDDGGAEAQFLIENIDDEIQLEHENMEQDEDSQAGEAYEILEAIAVDSKKPTVKTRITKKLVEKKPKNSKYCNQIKIFVSFNVK